MYCENELVLISALQHYSYCPRQCALIHVESIFDDNHLTMRGNAAHRQVDTPGCLARGTCRIERALPLFSETHGLIGKADVVEFDEHDNPFPVEYKHGKRHLSRHDDIQLGAQAICLEEMTGKQVQHGAIYHHSSRRRRDVHIDYQLRTEVINTAKAVRAMIQIGKLPPPVNDKRCTNCSLKNNCQPQMICQANQLSNQLLIDIIEETE